MDSHLLNDSKYFEKQELKWFSVNELRNIEKRFQKFLQRNRRFVIETYTKNSYICK
jgi:hypothetical protein